MYTAHVRIKPVIESIELTQKKLILLENDFNTTFKKQQSITLPNKPSSQPLLTNNNNITLQNINKELKSINIKKLSKQIDKDDNEINYYNTILDNIDQLYELLNKNKSELSLFTTSDEYKFNPNCHICCAKYWVSKIKDLQLSIINLDDQILQQFSLINNENFDSLVSNNEKNKAIRDNYYLLLEWKSFLQAKNDLDKITTLLNNIIIHKNILNKQLSSFNLKLSDINQKLFHFNTLSLYLYNQLLLSQQNESFRIWEFDFNQLIITKNQTIANIKSIENDIHYFKFIIPKIHTYLLLKDTYDIWHEYDTNLKILHTHELFHFKFILDDLDKFKIYNLHILNKPLIKKKLHLLDSIKLLDTQIKQLNDSIIKHSTINNYNILNSHNYHNLSLSLSNLDNTISLLEKIIHNFQAFRINLYDSFILNHLTFKANNILKSLSHIDTKPFKLDYVLSVHKDIIHINWLINNESSSLISDINPKQFISIHQASGYQHFSISLALRISLFFNKYQHLSNQLFIDEGFVNFDEFNLSIVPSFLKSLLSYFNSIIIVTHINLIQANVDETTEILYDKFSSVSKMNYNNFKKTKVKRNSLN